MSTENKIARSASALIAAGCFYMSTKDAWAAVSLFFTILAVSAFNG